jgi:hypothetical protein
VAQLAWTRVAHVPPMLDAVFGGIFFYPAGWQIPRPYYQ